MVALALIAALVVALDQMSKAWIAGNFVSHQVQPLIEGFLRLRYTQNTGAAFGSFQGWTLLLTLVSTLILGAIIVWAWRLDGGHRFTPLALGLIVGGALGNLIDRLRLGYVVDFIEVNGLSIELSNRRYTFPVFNVADSAITVGVILLMALMIFGKQEAPTASKGDGGVSDTPASVPMSQASGETGGT